MFTDDVPSSARDVYRDEMERARGFFVDRFGIETSDFTVVVGTVEELAIVVPEIVGRAVNVRFTGGKVLTGRDGITFVVLRYTPGTRLYLRAVAHEYVHVLQRELAGWSSDANPDDPVVRVSGFAPDWQVEGFAVYGNYLYNQTRPDRDPFIPYHFAPYRYVQCNPEGWDDPELELRRQEKACTFYDLAFLASIFIVEEMPALIGSTADGSEWLAYWRLLSEAEMRWTREELGPNEWRLRASLDWHPAFQQAFGISADDFYAAFGEWARSDVIAERADTRINYDSENCPAPD